MMARIRNTALLLLFACACAYANVPALGVDSVSSGWFRDWYQYGDLRSYLDNLCNYSTYEAEQNGEWGTADQLVFSIHGNSYKSNKFYIDGFRVDSRFDVGSTLYHMDMTEHTLLLDYHRSRLYFEADSLRMSRIKLSGNAGGIGGIAKSAVWTQELLHPAACHRLNEGNDKALTMRAHLVGAGGVDAVYGVEAFGRRFHQHVYANYARRALPKTDYQGITGMMEANNLVVQLDGQLPLPSNPVLDDLGYIFVARNRGDAFSEFRYNDNELATQTTYSTSVYGKKNHGSRGSLTTGLTWEVNDVRHNQHDFTRNLVDQDGEGFEPWYADGRTHSLSWALDYRLPILRWLDFHIDAYNSLLHFRPSSTSWHNDITYRTLDMAEEVNMYRIDWTSGSFTSGLLENSFSLESEYEPTSWLRLRGELGMTIDGILLRDKTVVTPCWEAQMGMHFSPTKWFEADVILGHYRTRYSYRDVLFLSNDYMNGTAQYSDGVVLTTTGGAYHSLSKGLQQPAYFMLDIPFTFIVHNSHRGTSHEFQVLTSVKKYYNTWTTVYEDEASAQVQTQKYSNEPYTREGIEVAYLVPGERRYKVVTEKPYCEGHFIMNTPFVLTNDLKYTYNGRHTFFTFSWQSYMVTNRSALGNGVLQNDIAVLSESMASPNILLNQANAGQRDGAIRRMGRADQDRGFIARVGLGWNITENWGIAANAKFKDGTPFCNFGSAIRYDEEGHAQAAIWHANTKGTNPVDLHFGQRKDAYWGLDLRVRYRGAIRGVPFGAELQCYNIWDFGNEMMEYCFDYRPETGYQNPSHRSPLMLSIPRGLTMSITIGLDRIHEHNSL